MTAIDKLDSHRTPILVTGAPGNMGTPLVGELLALGEQVRVAARDIENARAAFGENVEIVRFDFADPSTFAAFDGVERMFLLRPTQISDVKHLIGPALDAAKVHGVPRRAQPCRSRLYADRTSGTDVRRVRGGPDGGAGSADPLRRPDAGTTGGECTDAGCGRR